MITDGEFINKDNFDTTSYFSSFEDKYIIFDNLEKKTETISKAAGFTKAGTGMEVNPAYNLLEEDSFSFSSLIVMILFVILAGYLIIYNIFNL